jgi:membrane-bound lytic murein transglycosylase D
VRAKILILACLAPWLASAQVGLEDLVDGAQQWAEQNLDPAALDALSSGDREKVRKFLADFQKQLQGNYVLDLAALKATAQAILPILESCEETVPYAEWLRPRLDYLDVAEEARRSIPVVPLEPGKPLPPNPTPVKERQIWISRLAERPWPDKAKEHIPKLKPIFASQKIPSELVWIAEVESSFEPSALSPVGAAGMFQLMPATAKRFGLRSFPFDQRYRPEPSAKAAASYLQFLHKKFKDWRLALAAYNAGEGTVQRLLQKHKATTFDQIAPYLPSETQMYVPKVEALLLRREGVKLSELRVPADQG